jgi:hypothetical protein
MRFSELVLDLKSVNSELRYWHFSGKVGIDLNFEGVSIHHVPEKCQYLSSEFTDFKPV